MRLTGCYSALTVLLFAGCEESDQAAVAEFQVRDSAGIEIILAGAPEYPAANAWRVDAQPDLQIGRVAGGAEYLFQQVWDAAMAPDGRIAVSDGQALEIRVFDSTGTYLSGFGRRGEGPMEFRGPPWIALKKPDTLVVWDSGNYRLSWFDLEGTLLRQETLATTIATLSIMNWTGAAVWRTRFDGALLSTGPARSTRGEGLSSRLRRFVLIDPEAQVTHDFGSFPWGQDYTLNIGIGFSNDFAPSVDGALGPEPLRVALASPEEWEVRFYSLDGRLLRILRAPISRTPMTPAMRAARKAALEDLASQFRLPPGEGTRVDGEMPTPDSLPAISTLLWDVQDRLWVGHRGVDPGKSERYDVFDIAGHWLTTVQIPDEIGRILEIGEDYLLTRWSDELGVEYLRLYRLEKPTV